MMMGTVEDFRQRLSEIQPTGGRELRVEIVNASWNWKSFFEGNGTAYSGLTIQESMESVMHSFRFMKRSSLVDYKGGALRL